MFWFGMSHRTQRARAGLSYHFWSSPIVTSMTRYVDEPSNERLSPDLRQSEMQAAPTGDSSIWSITHLLGQLLGAPLDWKYSPPLYGTLLGTISLTGRTA